MRALFAAASLLAILCFCGSVRSLFATTAAYDPATMSGQAPGATMYYSGLYSPQVQSLQPTQSVLIQTPEAAQRGSSGMSSMAIVAAVIGTMAGRWWAKERMEKSRAQVARIATLAVGGQAATQGPPEKYAIAEASGHQFLLEEGKFYDLDHMAALDTGDKFNLNRIALVKDGENLEIGKPYVDGYCIEATVLRHSQGPKIRVFKYRPKKGTRKTHGHRTKTTRILIDSIKPVS